MRNASDVSRVVDAIANAVAVELASTGWRRRAPGQLFGLETLTRDLGNGVLATINVIPPLMSIGTAWPKELLVDFGVDFEPALDLTPLLTLPVMPILVRAPTTDGRSNGKVTIAGDRADQRAEAVREIVTVYATQSVEFAGRFDVAEILRRDIDGDDGKWWHQRYLTMLVALGRGDEALGAAAVTRGVVQAVQVFTRPGVVANPDWLRPPERAAYIGGVRRPRGGRTNRRRCWRISRSCP